MAFDTKSHPNEWPFNAGFTVGYDDEIPSQVVDRMCGCC